METGGEDCACYSCSDDDEVICFALRRRHFLGGDKNERKNGEGYDRRTCYYEVNQYAQMHLLPAKYLVSTRLCEQAHCSGVVLGLAPAFGGVLLRPAL